MILILNCGSQSIKWKLFDDSLNFKKKGKQEVFNFDFKNYQKVLIEELTKIKNDGGRTSIIGHRVVFGGKRFREPIKITGKVLKELERFNKFAPLHNPFNISGIKSAKKIFPEVQQWAVFDTEFFKDLPEEAKTYALPEILRKKYGFLRFGFHGISHEYVAREAAKKLKKPFEKLKIITLHLGGGASICAVKNGKAIDISMGFTPMEGLVMMTRAGDLDPGIIIELSKKFSAQRVNEILNCQSGVKGICGLSDMRKVLREIKRGNKKAKLALDIFIYYIKKYIGAYFTILNGCDVLVFTGAIGSGSGKIRNRICKNLKILQRSKIISIETDEELAIAQKIWKNKNLSPSLSMNARRA